MKIKLLFLFLFITISATAQYTLIPDKNFENALISQGIDKDGSNGKVLTSDISSLTSLNVSNSSITDLTGIQDFISLKRLDCLINQLTSLDLSKNTKLEYLACASNNLTALDLSYNTALTNFYCTHNQIATLDFSKNIALKFLVCMYNQITTLNVFGCDNLIDLNCSDNQLKSLDLSKNNALTTVNCSNNLLTTLDLSKNHNLTDLYCGNNQLSSLDLSKNHNLFNLSCNNNLLTSLDLSTNSNLINISCFSNKLTLLNISECTLLESLNCYENQLTTINISNCPLLYIFHCHFNKLETLDISKHSKIIAFYCYSNHLKNLNLKNGKNTLMRAVSFTNNPDLKCIQVDNEEYSNSKWPIFKDPSANYSQDCRELLLLPLDNFTIESKGETCLNENNGTINITAKANYNYVANINGPDYTLTNNTLAVSNLAPATYTIRITIPGQNFEQNFSVNIPRATTITGKSTISSRLASVEITEGTAPYTIFINGEEQFETTSDTFSVAVNKGDFLEVKTAKACEGIYLKEINADSIEAVLAHPNPTKGEFTIDVPVSIKNINIDLYTADSKIISSEAKSVTNGQIKLNIENQPAGIYYVKVYLNTPKYLKIIKK